MAFFAELFATSSIEKLRALGGKRILRRVLTGRDMVALGLASMIGGGIFTTIGPGVRMAGPAVIVSYLIAGAASFFAAFAYAELGSMVPISGSAYTYAYATMGKLVAWLIGFALVFEYAISGAPIAQQFSGAFQALLHQTFGVTIPVWMQGSHLVLSGPWWQLGAWSHSQFDIVGAVFVLLLTGLIAVGIRETVTINNIFVVLKVGALLVFIGVGAFMIHPHNWTPFAPHGWGLTNLFGGAGIGIVPGAALVFFTYIGFDEVTTVAEECRNPQRDVPVGVIGSLAIAAAIYCAIAVVLTGIVPWQQVSQNSALVSALAPLHNPFVDWTLVVGVMAATITVELAAILGQTRIFYVMARDGMLPRRMAHINPRFKTPFAMTFFVGGFIALMTLIVPLDNLLNLVNIGTLLAFIVVCAGVIYLRYKRPDIPRSFRAPLVPLFPILGIVLCAFLAIDGVPAVTWRWFVGALIVGLILFFAYGFRHSDPDAVVPVEEPETTDP